MRRLGHGPENGSPLHESHVNAYRDVAVIVIDWLKQIYAEEVHDANRHGELLPQDHAWRLLRGSSPQRKKVSAIPIQKCAGPNAIITVIAIRSSISCPRGSQ